MPRLLEQEWFMNMPVCNAARACSMIRTDCLASEKGSVTARNHRLPAHSAHRIGIFRSRNKVAPAANHGPARRHALQAQATQTQSHPAKQQSRLLPIDRENCWRRATGCSSSFKCLSARCDSQALSGTHRLISRTAIRQARAGQTDSDGR